MKFGISVFPILLFIIVLNMWGCNIESNSGDSTPLAPSNLEKYGIPAVIQIPQDAVITEDPQAREKALLIKSPRFNMRVEVSSLDSAETAISWLRDRVENEKLEGDFSKMVVEDSLGYVVERKDEELGTNYHFQYILPQANRLVVFSEGIPQKKSFDLETIMRMYNAVRQ